MYQRIEGDRWRHVYVVGDLHGCLDQFVSLLKVNHFDPWQDLVISVGDLIDRGPDSPGCLALLDKPWFKAVRGNHEEMALAAMDADSNALWLMNGGSWFRALPAERRARIAMALARCRALPLIIELHSRKRVIVIAHADYPADHYAWQRPVDTHCLVWSRERLHRHRQGKGEAISGADAFYFGHTPIREVLHFYNQYYIDTGAVFGNKLTLVAIH